MARRIAASLKNSSFGAVLGYRDFRLLWIGAFLSFTGSWIQIVAQGYYVYQTTQSEAKLALVSFCSSVPVFVFGLVAGSFSDSYDKRVLMVITQALLGLAAIYIAIAIWFGFISYPQIVVNALLVGLVSSVEMPTRQSIVSRVVPPELLATAVPIQSMTFNVARIFGPAMGAVALTLVGVPLCYLLNGISFIALIWAALAIRSNLAPTPREKQPMVDLIAEGMMYTLKDVRLKTLFILETITAMFGLSYVALLPAYVQQNMGVVDDHAARSTLGLASTAVGIGALVGLLLVTHLAQSESKGTVIRGTMWLIGLCLLGLSFAHSAWLVFILLAGMGLATVAQFNTTSALFQILSPERLRGRVLAMHIWALNGLSPFGVLLFGGLAEATRTNSLWRFGSMVVRLPSTGVSLTFQVGAVCVLIGAVGAMLARRGLAGLEPT
jgi:MFS family permease